ncbi:MAG TPA: nickel-responsive transcriptional regulator NikR [Chthonomonadaceae bacterium]|nr:nickel-responsive transcriptional regulator NikR [Chthonomonadaceae bacterium]
MNKSQEGGETEDELIRFSVSMPAHLVRDLDNWRNALGYSSRSEAVRDLVRDRLVEEQWKAEEDSCAEKVGVVTLVYQHSTRQLSDHLTEMQHHHHAVAHAALHIHLTPENCLEVIVLRGAKAEVNALANHLISTKGVLHGRFIATTTGEDIA